MIIPKSLSPFIEEALQYASNSRCPEVYPEHLLIVLLQHDPETGSLLKNMGKDIRKFEEFAKAKLNQVRRASNITKAEILISPKVEKVFETAGYIQGDLRLNEINSLCLFAALWSSELVFTSDEIKSLDISLRELLTYLKSNLSQHYQNQIEVEKEMGSDSDDGGKITNALAAYCDDKTLLAKENQLDPIAGREKEIQILTETLLRRSKPNAIIIGEPGVGKTALVDGLAQKIVNQSVPLKLIGAKLFELDLGRLMAGASYKGEVEKRVKEILKEIKQFDKAILFIDEIHLLQDEKSGFTSVATLLKPELARGRITVIGATTLAEYTKYLEKDQAFKRRFEEVRIDEPENEQAAKMIDTVILKYQTHFNLSCEPAVIRKSVELAKRYRRERFLPDSALDLIDSTMSALKVANELTPENLQTLRTRFNEILNKKTGDQNSVLNELKDFWDEIRKEKLHHIHFAKTSISKDKDDFENAESLSQYISNLFEKLTHFCDNKQEGILVEDLNAVISHKTGISMGKLEENEQKRLSNIEANLKKRVVGQDYAITQIANEIRVNRAELGDERKPIGSFFFFGPTGTGKTELAKAIAEFLFNDESFMIRFDMSEYTEKHSVATFTGSPAGYVGYEEGGVLVNRIRQKPYSVILFDEIEKAHPTVYDLFLQIIDEGKLTDKLGKVGDFSNAIIIFTSNAAQEKLTELYSENKMPESREIKEVLKKATDKEGNLLFRLEFINKLSHIVPFAPISDEVAFMILDLKLNEFAKILKKKGYEITFSQKAKEYLKNKDFDPQFGARSLMGTIRQYLRQPIAKMIVEGQLKQNQHISVGIKKNEISFSVS